MYKKIITILFTLMSLNSYSKESISYFLNISGTQYNNETLYSPELELQYRILGSPIYSNLNMGFWATLNNSEYSKNGQINNYQKIGLSYRILNMTPDKKYYYKTKITTKGNRLIYEKFRIKNKYKKNSGLFFNVNFVRNNFNTRKKQIDGYGFRLMYNFNDYPFRVGIEHTDINKNEFINYKINSLIFSLSF